MYINRCKDNVKFRLSKGNENIFSFLSVRKLIKSNKKPKENSFFFVFSNKRLQRHTQTFSQRNFSQAKSYEVSAT